MKKLVGVFIIFTLASCSSGLYIVSNEYIMNKDVKAYNLNDFDFYVFNICEEYTKKEFNNNRFCGCPDGFFEVSAKDSIKKVEELYLLIHKKCDLAIYMTSRSHKYIYDDQTGFLNDRKVYENSLILDQIEYFYVGSIDSLTNRIRFENIKNKKGEDIILHYNSVDFPNIVSVGKVNIATAENNYDNFKEIKLDSIFNISIDFVKSDYKIYFYNNDGKVGETVKKEIKKLYFTPRNERLEIIFAFENFQDKLFKVKSKRIPYTLNYSKIDTLKTANAK